VLEPKPPVTEIDLAGDFSINHPLQRAVDGGAADLLVLLTHQVDQVVGTEMAVLAQENADDQIAFTGALSAGRPKAIEVGRLSIHDLGNSIG